VGSCPRGCNDSMVPRAHGQRASAPAHAGRGTRIARRKCAWILALLAASACHAEPEQTAPGMRKPAASTDAATASGAREPAPTYEPEAGNAADGQGAGSSPPLFLQLPDHIASVPHGEAQVARLCARKHNDPLADLFCSGSPPRISSLAELLALLGIRPGVYVESQGFAVTGHSTALSKRSVSTVNPRVIFLQIPSSVRPMLAVGFMRGERLVEIATQDRTTSELTFYVLAFGLPCADSGGSCAPGDLLTPAIERDWSSVDLYDETDLTNTALDCRVCHQPGGPGTSKLLRMQEIETPWTHWFDDQTQGGRALLADFIAMHGDEVYAAVPAGQITQARAGLMAAFVRIAGSTRQPNEFQSAKVETEVELSAPGQPTDNQARGQSKTWQAGYASALRAESIPTPYHDVKVTDPAKLSRVQRAYADYRAGILPTAALPDIRDVFPDDPVALYEMGFAVDERLDDPALMVAACGLCHNQRLDQSLSRAKFDTDLSQLTAEAKQTAIARLNLPPHDPQAMPPQRTHALSAAGRARLVGLLSR
jgi:hypothetical protein